jgi:hypothetical protein
MKLTLPFSSLVFIWNQSTIITDPRILITYPLHDFQNYTAEKFHPLYPITNKLVTYFLEIYHQTGNFQ